MMSPTDPDMPAATDGEREILAPLGRLRVGVHSGSPLSLTADGRHGLTRGLGAAFAARLGVPADYVTFQRIAEVLEAMKAGLVDFTISNATPLRAADVDFSQTLLSLELGYLVPATSQLTDAGDIDRPGMRIGVTKGSTSERTLPARFNQARVVAAQSTKDAIDMLIDGELDLYATNKPILFEMSDAMPGARILAGNWGIERIAIAVPKGRERGMQTLRRFVSEVQSSGLLDRLQREAGLRGTVSESRA